jgi:hypothetical protein
MMATTEERMKILKMISDGKITAEEGARLLSALKDNRKMGRGGVAISRGMERGTLRVRVTDTVTGKTKVNINLPIGLVEAAMRIGTQYAPELGQLDMGQIIAEIKAGTTGKIIEANDEEDGEHVEIFIE